MACCLEIGVTTGTAEPTISKIELQVLPPDVAVVLGVVRGSVQATEKAALFATQTLPEGSIAVPTPKFSPRWLYPGPMLVLPPLVGERNVPVLLRAETEPPVVLVVVLGPAPLATQTLPAPSTAGSLGAVR